MKQLLKRALQSHSESFEESKNNLQHFAGILDHVTKIVTTIALLVAVELSRQKHPMPLISVVYWLIWIFFFIYLQRLFEHCLIFVVDRWDLADPRSSPVRWSIGISTLLFSLVLLNWGNDTLTELVTVGFLKD